jgi:hypothetical protein
MSALSKYEEALSSAPARGTGLHGHIMKCARLGVLAEIPAPQIIEECEQKLLGARPNEIREAVSKAAKTEHVPSETKPVSKFVPKYINPMAKFIMGVPQEEMELIEASPIRLVDDPAKDARLVLETLYDPEEHLFIGTVYGKTVKPVKDWLAGDMDAPHVIPNPMTGEFGKTESGSESRRCESTVSDLRYAVCEMDSVPLEHQVAFWLKCISMKIPVAAVIHSGGKSLHGWVKVGCGTDHEKWNKDVKGWLFGEFGEKYGLDKACATKARLSRLPGHYRKDKNRQQTLLYLNGAL